MQNRLWTTDEITRYERTGEKPSDSLSGRPTPCLFGMVEPVPMLRQLRQEARRARAEDRASE